MKFLASIWTVAFLGRELQSSNAPFEGRREGESSESFTARVWATL